MMGIVKLCMLNLLSVTDLDPEDPWSSLANGIRIKIKKKPDPERGKHWPKAKSSENHAKYLNRKINGIPLKTSVADPDPEVPGLFSHPKKSKLKFVPEIFYSIPNWTIHSWKPKRWHTCLECRSLKVLATLTLKSFQRRLYFWFVPILRVLQLFLNNTPIRIRMPETWPKFGNLE